MSILHSRIIAHGGQGRSQQATSGNHPVGTRATPMIMPSFKVHYDAGTGYYQTISPAYPATGDVNAVPLATLEPGSWGKVAPAGHP